MVGWGVCRCKQELVSMFYTVLKDQLLREHGGNGRKINLSGECFESV
jgi:hypothetical protein